MSFTQTAHPPKLRFPPIGLGKSYRKALRHVARFLTTQESYAFQFWHEPTLPLKSLRFAQAWIYPTLQFLFPTPLPRMRTPLGEVYRQTWWHPSRPRTPEQESTLAGYPDAIRLDDEKRAFMAAHPRYTFFQKVMQVSFATARVASLALALNVYAQTQETGPVTIKQYREEKAFRMKPYEVRLFTDMVKLPHMAIQMNDEEIFSYGVSHLSKSSTFVCARTNCPKNPSDD